MEKVNMKVVPGKQTYTITAKETELLDQQEAQARTKLLAEVEALDIRAMTKSVELRPFSRNSMMKKLN